MADSLSLSSITYYKTVQGFPWWFKDSVYIYIPAEFGSASNKTPKELSIDDVRTSFAEIPNKGIAFDLDGTLIDSDGSYTFPSTLGTLEKYAKDDYTIVIFSNQKVYPKNPLSGVLDKVSAFLKKVNINPFVFLATKTDKYRKPSIGMYELFRDLTAIDVHDYVGDASGPGDPNPLYQWSDVDRKFAENAGLHYLTPAEFFQQ